MFKHRLRLLSGDTRKPIEEFFQPCARLEVLKQSRHGNASAAKDPGATHPVGVTLDSQALRPVQHEPYSNKDWAAAAKAR